MRGRIGTPTSTIIYTTPRRKRTRPPQAGPVKITKPDGTITHELPLGLKTCKFCGRDGLVWFKTAKGRYVLAAPKLPSMDPNPDQLHLCTKDRRGFVTRPG